jgi:outer membrane protein assembly factor BamB
MMAPMTMLKVINTSLLIGLLSSGAAAMKADWPQFRGPWGNGLASAPGEVSDLALVWSETNHVKWKTAIPLKGWSTPVIMEGRVWLTSATPEGTEYFAICVDADSGKILVNEKLFHSDKPEPLGNPINSYASPSPAIEHGRVYIHFGSYGTACLDSQSGKTIWTREDLACRHFRGPASSAYLFENSLILTLDGIDLQYVTAMDKATGKTLWTTHRTTAWNDLNADGKPIDGGDFRKAFSTPLVVEANGKKQMLSVGARSAYSYDPQTGRELWKIHYEGFSNAAMPVFGNGLAFIVTGFGKTELWAVRTDGTGDVTDTHVAWKTSKQVPRMPSPLLVEGLLYMPNEGGNLTCLEAMTGKEVWKQKLEGHFSASPIFAGGRIYNCNEEGKTIVVKAGRDFEILAENTLDSGLMASPAASDKALYLRTKTHLYRVE